MDSDKELRAIAWLLSVMQEHGLEGPSTWNAEEIVLEAVGTEDIDDVDLDDLAIHGLSAVTA